MAGIYIVSGYLVKENGEETILFYRMPAEKHEACTFLADCIIRELGDGDGENGGRGSLKNCYGDIWNALFFTGHYEYADCRFAVHESLKERK